MLYIPYVHGTPCRIVNVSIWNQLRSNSNSNSNKQISIAPYASYRALIRTRSKELMPFLSGETKYVHTLNSFKNKLDK